MKIHGGKVKTRHFNQNPLIKNIRNYYLSTIVGKTSMRISDWNHFAWIDFLNWVERKFNLFHWKRRFVYPITLGAGFIYGYVFVSYLFGKNIVENEWNVGTLTPWDYS